MAPGGGKGGAEVAKEELQAIVLADSFSGSFRPCSLEMPKVLLPLLNVPMLDYVVEFLIASGVSEIFIFCVNLTEVVQEYVASSKWAGTVSIRCVTGPKCTGAGDALREMDRTGFIRSHPFIVISGDVVATVNLEAVVAGHKRRRAESSLTIMTAVLAKVGYEAGVRARGEDLVVGLNSRTGQILAYEDGGGTSIELPALELCKEGHREMELRDDLIDCHIYVCSPEVLVSFSDNWDYQELPRFIRNEVQNREMGSRLFAHLARPDEYAARIHDPHVYHSVSKDLMSRWLYPLVPDHNNMRHGGKQQQDDYCTSFRYQRRWLYKEEQVNVSRSARLGKAVMLGKGTVIGAESRLSVCTVGRRCVIGANVVLQDCHVWDDVTIEDGAVVESSILCGGVVVRRNARVERGSLLSYGVIIGQGVTIPPFSRICRPHPEAASAAAVVGADGLGGPWVPHYDDERVPEEVLRSQSMGASEEDQRRRARHAQLGDEVDEDEEDEDEDGPLMGDLVMGLSGVSIMGGATPGVLSPSPSMGGGAQQQQEAGSAWCDAVVHDMIVSGWASRHPVSNTLLEVKSFKFAQNRSFASVARAVVPAMLDLSFYPDHTVEQNRLLHSGGAMSPPRTSTGGAGPLASSSSLLPVAAKASEALANLKEQIEHWRTLIKALNQEDEVEDEMLAAVEAYALHNRGSPPNAGLYAVFGVALVTLVQMEVVQKPAAMRWVQADRDPGSPAGELWAQERTQRFVTWLRDYDDDDSDSDDDDDSDSDDDDDESSDEEDEEEDEEED